MLVPYYFKKRRKKLMTMAMQELMTDEEWSALEKEVDEELTKENVCED